MHPPLPSLRPRSGPAPSRRQTLSVWVAGGLLAASLSLIGAEPIAPERHEAPGATAAETMETPSAVPVAPREGLSLRAAVAIALRNNRALEKAALNREVQRFDLRVAEDTFVPNVDVSSNALYNPITTDGARTEYRSGYVTVAGRQRLPTGGRVAIFWDNFRSDTTSSNPDYSSSIYLQVDQPLLRGGGFRPNLAALRIARLAEKSSILSFRRNVMGTVADVIFTYRRLLQAKLQLEVAEGALQRAREQLRINRALVDSGNLPPVEIIQTEADIASQEFNLLTARSALESARYALIRLLDVDRDAALDPTDPVVLPEFTLELADAQRIAFANRPDFLQLQHNLTIAGYSREVARNNLLWDLSVGSRYRLGGSGGSFSSAVDRTFSQDDEDWAVGVTLNIPIGDLTRRQSFLRARSGELQARIDLAEARDSIDIELRDAFRSLELSRQRVRVASVARELTASKLEIEKAKLQTGRTTNFAIVSFQADLVRARLNEINAQISYLNALTDLDQTLGTTLTTWGIAIVELGDEGPPQTIVEPALPPPEGSP